MCCSLNKSCHITLFKDVLLQYITRNILVHSVGLSDTSASSVFFTITIGLYFPNKFGIHIGILKITACQTKLLFYYIYIDIYRYIYIIYIYIYMTFDFNMCECDKQHTLTYHTRQAHV